MIVRQLFFQLFISLFLWKGPSIYQWCFLEPLDTNRDWHKVFNKKKLQICSKCELGSAQKKLDTSIRKCRYLPSCAFSEVPYVSALAISTTMRSLVQVVPKPVPGHDCTLGFDILKWKMTNLTGYDVGCDKNGTEPWMKVQFRHTWKRPENLILTNLKFATMLVSEVSVVQGISIASSSIFV